MVDASFEKISSISPHPNADRLEIAEVSNYPCIISKGEFKVGDIVLFIRPDAALVCPEKFLWQAAFTKYLGNGGRVKTVKLRGEFSNGIIASLDVVSPFMAISEFENTPVESKETLLLDKLGITHYSPPAKVISGNIVKLPNLPFGLQKTDEDNWQNLPSSMLGFGETVLVTKKLDGCSCTIAVEPDGAEHICGRSIEVMPDACTIYNIAAKPWVQPLREYAKKHGCIIVARGEVVGDNINKNAANIDCHGKPTFNLYGVISIDPETKVQTLGYYGSKLHFLSFIESLFDESLINAEMKESALKAVPVVEKAVCTKELLQKYVDMPASFGEGVVINWSKGSYKSKSQDYYSKL